MTHKATCQTCKQFATFSSRRSIATKDLPQILAVNAGVYSDESMKFWLDSRTGSRTTTFLKPTVEICGEVAGVDDPETAIYELRVSIQTALDYSTAHAFNLQAVVVQVIGKDEQSHLVAIVKGM